MCTRLLFLISAIAGLAVLTGCDSDCGCAVNAVPPNCPVAPLPERPAREEAPAPKPAVISIPKVSGKWTGRWESIGHAGHGGGLSCEALENGPQKWTATFTAEFGPTKSYQVKLEGRPGDHAVLFGGTVDLGKADGGIFTWSGNATAQEFTGLYEGGGDTGIFKMARAETKK